MCPPAPASKTPPSPWWDNDRHSDRRGFLLARDRIKKALRRWFETQGFIEVETGIAQLSPGNETHLHAFETTSIGPDLAAKRLYLHTSPEFACKKLLAAGETKIFTFAPVFRNRERGRLHSPEFTMLEWYRTGTSCTDQYEQVQRDCAEIIAAACIAIDAPTLRHKNRIAEPHAVPIQILVPDAFEALFHIDLAATINPDGTPASDRLHQAARSAGHGFAADLTWQDMVSHFMGELERRYGDLPSVNADTGNERIAVLDTYPACMSPLATNARQSDYTAFNHNPTNPHAADPKFAKRFEIFASGVELANGFGENNDPEKVHDALEAEMQARQDRYGERYPIDDDFIASLAKLPPASGCALGFDRLVMLATGADHIDQVRWTPWPIAAQ